MFILPMQVVHEEETTMEDDMIDSIEKSEAPLNLELKGHQVSASGIHFVVYLVYIECSNFLKNGS